MMNEQARPRGDTRQGAPTPAKDSMTVIVGSEVTGVMIGKVIAIDKWFVALGRALRRGQVSQDVFFRLQKNGMDIARAFDAVIQEMKQHPGVVAEATRLTRLNRPVRNFPPRPQQNNPPRPQVNGAARGAANVDVTSQAPAGNGSAQRKKKNGKAHASATTAGKPQIEATPSPPETITVPATAEADASGL